MPEGFEDVSLEGIGGEASRHVQAKSRGEDLGLFPVHEAVDHILHAWDRHLARDEADSQLVVVFERGVKGEVLPTGLDASVPTLAESSPDGSKLLSSLKDKCRDSGISEADTDLLLSSVVAIGAGWDQVTDETVASIGEVVELPALSLSIGADLLVGVVARASAENASRRHADRRRLDKTEIVGQIQRFAEQIDVETLQAAIRDGLCELFTYGVEELDEGGRFYEGEATQPFHVASGLVMRRPDVLEKILSGLHDRFAVVITGPSGVGKSAVLWTVPRELPGVVWFRVKRLAVEDVPVILRLARASAVSTRTPVGFLVDSAGTGQFRGWERLRAEAAAVPGMLLVATARTEDLTVLGSLTECATIAVQLDQHSAETIYRGLVRRGATSEAHWQEAFERSDGLTLEFTHLLTRGQRLRDVIEDQVRRRVIEERHRELRVLALASTADRWSAAIATTDIVRVCELSEEELQGALYRLRAEHLVEETDGWIGGLHQLRSTAICEAVHGVPPPTLGQTIKRLISVVPATQLHRFIAAMLIDNPEARSIIRDIARELAPDLERLAACIQGLRLADFRELAKIWDEIAEEHDVPAAARLAFFAFAIGGTRPPDIFDSKFLEAWEAIGAVPEQDSRNDLVAAVGSHTIGQLVASETDPHKATHLLAVLAGCEPESAVVIAAAVNAESQLAAALREAPVDVLADCVAAARGVDPAVAHALTESMGGEQTIIARIRADNPWIIVLEIRTGGSSPIGYARFLHVSDTLQGSPDEQALGLARTLLRCLPRIESVDVQAVLPGGREIAMGGYTGGSSQLKREFDRTDPAVEWSRERTRSAAALIGTTDTARLSQALPLLDEAADLVREWGTALVVTGRPPGGDLPQRLAALHESGRSILPRLCDTRSGDAVILGQTAPDLTDDLSATISDIAGNVIPRLRQRSQYRALAAYIAETVIDKHIAGAASEPWRLIGIDGHPPSLDSLKSDLEDLGAVVVEMSIDEPASEKMRRAAKKGSASRSLQRAAAAARASQRRRQQRRRTAIQAACRTTGLRTRVFDIQQTATFMFEYRVSVELGSLLDWNEAIATLQPALIRVQGLGETYLLVPLRNNKPVPGLAMTLINDLWPAPNPDGLGRLPPAHPSQLADTFERAHLALQALSGMSDLPDDQKSHPEVQAFAQKLGSDWETAYESLSGLPEDPVTDVLLAILGELATRVQSELDGTSTAPTFASQIAAALTEEATTEIAIVLSGRSFAYEWDINPSTAIEQLAAFDD